MAEGMAGSVEEKMDRVGNALAKTQFMFQIRDFGQLGEGMKYARSAAVAAKALLEDTLAVIGQLKSAGMQGSMAGTAFQAMLRTEGKASEEFGFEVVRTRDGAMDLVGTLQNFKAALGSGDVRGATLVFHQTFHFHGAGPESEDELRRRMEDIMRRASVKAGLVEAEGAF